VHHWNLNEIETPAGSRSPVVLHSENGQARVVLIGLLAGQELGEHQVKEAAFLLVVSGRVRIDSGDGSLELGPGELVRFEPDERRSVTSDGGARVVLTLAPWPGIGHYRGEERAGLSAS
jgi:quercetin dioxygenase-like cupin family protein